MYYCRFTDNIRLMLLPLITTAIGLAGQAFGANQSAKANRNAENYLQGRMNSLDSRFAKDYYQDFLNTESARSMVGKVKSQFTDMAKNIKGSSAAGSTAEAEIAQKDNLNKRLGDALSNITGYGTQYKQGIRNAYDYQKNMLQNQQMGILQQKAAQWDNFGNNVAGAGEGLMTAYASGAFTKPDAKPKIF